MPAGLAHATVVTPSATLHPAPRGLPTTPAECRPSLTSPPPAADLCLFFVGTTSFSYPLTSVEERQHYGTYAAFPPVVEAEGMDRQDLLLPGRQLNLIQVGAERRGADAAQRGN